MSTRSFRPPPICGQCDQRPVLGETLFCAGATWLCADCLTNETGGKGVMAKLAPHSVESDQRRALSMRAKSAGDITDAVQYANEAGWHNHAAQVLHDRGNRLARQVVIVGTEAVPLKPGFLKDTLSDPDLVAVEASEARGRLMMANDIVALGVDVANTVKAANTAEKLLAHEVALAHKVAMDQVHMAARERDPAIEMRRLNVAARMMATVQQGMLTLQRLKTGGTQTVVVQHVRIESGGQAVVGNIQTERSLNAR